MVIRMMQLFFRSICVCLFVCVVLLCAATTPVMVYAQIPDFDVETTQMVNPPNSREGAVFGNEDGPYMFFAGGVHKPINQTRQSATASNETYAYTAYDDIYLFSNNNRSYTKCATRLPTPVFFGTGGYWNGSLYILGGLTGFNASNAYSAIYSLNMYVVTFPNTSAGTTCSVVTKAYHSITTLYRQHASSMINNGILYVYGGLIGDRGTVEPDVKFFSIDLNTFIVQVYQSDDANAPVSNWVTPVLMPVGGSTRYMLVFSGLNSSYTGFAPSDVFYVFDTTANAWLPPSSVVAISSNYSYVQANIAYSSLAFGPQNRWAIVSGGSQGVQTGTNNLMYILFASQDEYDSSFFTLIVYLLPMQLVYAREKQVFGFDFEEDAQEVTLQMLVSLGAQYHDLGADVAPDVYPTNTTLFTFHVPKSIGSNATSSSSSSSSSTSSPFVALASSSLPPADSSSVPLPLSSSGIDQSSITGSDDSSSSGSSSSSAATVMATLIGILGGLAVVFFVYRRCVQRPFTASGKQSHERRASTVEVLGTEEL